MSENIAACQTYAMHFGCCLAPGLWLVLLPHPLCSVHLHDAHVRGRRSGHGPSSGEMRWQSQISLLPEAQGALCKFRAGSHMATGFLPPLSLVPVQ